jgi:NAD(P)-dependent dehydrogenase (short-subunit alcohol dehydrogenase family)
LNKYILIVGGGSRIGKALISRGSPTKKYISIEWSREIAINKDNYENIIVNCDITNFNTLSEVFLEIDSDISNIVYMPRFRTARNFSRIDQAHAQMEFDLSVMGLINCLNVLDVDSKNGMRIDSIVALSTVLGSRVSRIEEVGYHIGKAALEHLIRVLAIRLGPNGTRANAISIGFIQGPKEVNFRKEIQTALENTHPLGKPPDLDDILRVIEFLISDQSKAITGQIISVDGGSQLFESFDLTLKSQGINFRDVYR